MTDGGNVPVTVQGQFQYSGSQLAIGSQSYGPNPGDLVNAYWFVVVDLVRLEVVANEITTTNDAVPQSVLNYAGSPKFLLIVATQALRTDNVPQGALYTFLKEQGAGPKLDMAEQINTQLGTGTIGNVCYIYVGTLDTTQPGFEAFSYTDLVVLTFQLMPVQLGGGTIYTPIEFVA